MRNVLAFIQGCWLLPHRGKPSLKDGLKSHPFNFCKKGELMNNLLENVIREYYFNKEKDYIFFLSKSKKKKITTERLILRLSPEHFSHLLGCQKLSDMTFTKHSVVLFNKLYTDLNNQRIDTNIDFNNIKNSIKFDLIVSRLELLNDFKRLIVNPEIKLYEYNSNATQIIPTKIVYDYVIEFKDTNCIENCYLFCKKNNLSSFIIEPVSIFKTKSAYHKGHICWNVESFYVTQKSYEKKLEELYLGYPLGYK